jgi:hypothetical protein
MCIKQPSLDLLNVSHSKPNELACPASIHMVIVSIIGYMGPGALFTKVPYVFYMFLKST